MLGVAAREDAREPERLSQTSLVKTRKKKVKRREKPFFHHALISSFLFIIRELDFIITRLLVVRITCIATLRQFEPIDEHEVTSAWHVEDRT